jgi:hypothetical protein
MHPLVEIILKINAPLFSVHSSAGVNNHNAVHCNRIHCMKNVASNLFSAAIKRR